MAIPACHRRRRRCRASRNSTCTSRLSGGAAVSALVAAVSALVAAVSALVAAGQAGAARTSGASGAPGRICTLMAAPCRRAEHGSTMTSTMLDVNIDRSDPVPLHDQVAAQIRRAIADGEAGPGDRLPLAKDLAAVLGVNKNTVLRALHLLRDEGLLEFRRGRGITVSGTPQRSAVLAQVRSLVEYATRQGYGRSDIIQMITELPQDS